MPCYFPLRGVRDVFPNTKTGKFGIRNISARSNYLSGERVVPPGCAVVDLPCGQCIGCRLERSRKWAVRCMHEASLHETSCFLTMTYDDVNLPEFGTLVKSHFQDFIRSLRKRTGSKIRYFHCGEYGERLGRPHYHALLFGYEPHDKVLWSIRDDIRLYSSDYLASIWSKGAVMVGDITFDSAAYVARYVTKKVTGNSSRSHYEVMNVDTGEIYGRLPEYCTMSLKPGIGAGWFSRYSSDVFPSDFLIHNGVKMKPPRYYDNLYELSGGDMLSIKDKRERLVFAAADDNTLSRLKVRHKVKLSKFNQLKRSYENEA